LIKAREAQVTVTNCVHYADKSIAEYALALLLSVQRKIPTLNQEIRKQKWSGYRCEEISGKTVGIVGFGGIGQAFAKIVKFLGADVLVWDANPSQDLMDELSADRVESLSELMTRSDIVSLHLPLLDSTRELIKLSDLNCLRSGSTIIQTARSQIVEQVDGINALHIRASKGDIAVGIDVFDTEPMPLDDPIFSAKNAVLTPHNAFRGANASKALILQQIDCIKHYFNDNPINVMN
ncbi:MAG: D-2-hydroxyacid dehydrogenase family protein, partial [Candidatus Ancillula sp.]|jgi:phosphoglycerate dehydrogenase-like enzyme|nr:D-2-hydroxyacid dehydrogenase family protein [Candidatus Ancillula sp.]